MRLLLLLAAALQVAAVVYCTLLLRRHRNAAAAWLSLLGALLSMLVWRLVMTTGITPNLAFNTIIAIWGSVCAVLAMWCFGREISRRERAESDRDRLLASERAARADAERASRIKDDFMATLSHELRSPLAAMLGWCTLARRSTVPPDVARALDTIERNARMQSRLVDDLLDATRMQAGSLHLDRLPVSLDVPVLAAIDAVRPSAETRRIAIQVRCVTPAPVVDGDQSRLQQIVSNLLVNAVKFSHEGGTVEVSVATANGGAELRVRDAGIGIDPAFMPLLFQRFRQAETGNARRHGGLGLGLSIVSSLAQLHGGDVQASSDGPNTGATFVVRLPLSAVRGATVDAPLEAPLETRPGAQRDAPLGARFETPRDTTATTDRASLFGSEVPGTRLESLARVRVLVIDDEADVRGAIAGLLESAGAAVRAMASGQTIDATLADFRPDVLLLDIGMPGEDGYTLLRRIRSRLPATGRHVPAVSLTAHARDEDRQRALEAGFEAHLTKPMNVALLLGTIRRVVDEASPSAPLRAERSHQAAS